MDFLSVFNPSRLLILSLSFFFISFFFPLMPFFFFPLSSLFLIWLYVRLQLVHPSTVPFSQYLPKHYRDRRPKRTEMNFDDFTEFMKHINVSDIQWVVEWWHLSGMVNQIFKDNCVLSVGLHCCSYYFTCRIARKFGDH